VFSDFTILDLFIGLFVLLVVARGARTGFLAGVFSLVGVVVGAAVGSRFAQNMLPDNESVVFGAGITLVSILAFAVLGDVIARAVGGSIRSRLTGPTSSALDGVGGAALGMALSLTLVWAVGIFALQTPPLASIHPALQNSKVIGELTQRMPSQMLTTAVAQLDPLPQIRGPEVDLDAPEGSILEDPEVLAATAGTVRVTGIACGYGVEGSGWVAAPDLIVTNAHVVAGEAATQVQPGGSGGTYGADVVLFDARNDIAVLRVPGLGIEPLPITDARPGEDSAVIGFPGNGPLDIQPARTGDTRRVISSDAYNQGPVERTVTSFRVSVRPGNSGGPAVNENGEVISTIFASRANSDTSGYGIPSQIVEQHLATATERYAPVSTGSCAN